MRKRQSPFTNSDARLSVPELQRYAEGWLLDGEIRQHSSRTLEARRSLVEKLLWFLRTQEIPDCDAQALRQFLSYCSKGHSAPGGRWGNKRMTRPVKPGTIATYHRILRALPGHGRSGRPRKKGKRLPLLAQGAQDPKTSWTRVRVCHGYRQGEREVEIVWACRVWYNHGIVVPIRYVLGRDPRGKFATQALVRYPLWRETTFGMCGSEADSPKVEQVLLDRMIDTLCYAA